MQIETRHDRAHYNMPQLDGLRAFAVSAVIVHDFWPAEDRLIALLGLQTLEYYDQIGDVKVNAWFIEPVRWALMFVWAIDRASL